MESYYILLKYEYYYYLKTGVQTVSKGTDVGVQCSLPPGPPLTLLKDPNDSTTEEEVEEDLESSMSDSSYIFEDSDESRTEHTPR